MPSSCANAVPTPADVDGSPADGGDDQPHPAKRRRISFACNYCRNRKTRCDEQKPSCRACIAAGPTARATPSSRANCPSSARAAAARPSRSSPTGWTSPRAGSGSTTAATSPRRRRPPPPPPPPPPPRATASARQLADRFFDGAKVLYPLAQLYLVWAVGFAAEPLLGHLVVRNAAENEEERRAFWLGIYAFEKFLAFSMGRLSSIDDEECYPPHANGSSEAPIPPGSSSREKAFAVTIDLARILSEIGRRSAIVSRKEDGVTGDALKAVIAEKVQTTGEAKLLLTRWGESVPDELRPTSDILIGSKICPFASFISMHYNNALVILSRNSLLISEEAISSGANIIAKGKPWDYIVRNGQSIAANAARKMLRIVVETLDSKSNAVFPSLLAALNALAALAVHVVTHPGSRISAMDFHLIKTASDAMKEVYARLRGDRMFDSMLQKVDAVLQQATPAPGRLADPPHEHWAGQGQAKEAGPAPELAAGTMFNQNYALSGARDFPYGPLGSAMPVPGDEWSPSLSDGVGWDWSCFSQLLADQFQPQ
ncbi:fungal specific transcription factor domain-containing protein [Colletotrichum plurivorum]|uniref:Fungal specific transcription factor domain-containing protein n=1 Tax=Colletotrichum plurivorum TaxID=2175906 RepID=A0A8H6U5J3_9PEZI|nr:fungal specific transcription factor domain-containing protein [Colletotrichum plurivorum]